MEEKLSENGAHILVVEDETAIRDLMALHLLRQGYRVSECQSSEEALKKLETQRFDLAICDWMLPGMSGVEFIKILKNKLTDAPVLMVTAKADPQSIVEGLENGADDYLSKPFVPSVLLARVKALLRRAKPSTSSKGEIQISGLTVNFESYEARYQGELLHFTPSEFKLLGTLLQNRGCVLTREQLIENIQGEGISVIGRTIDTHVFGIRKKLGDWGDNIETIRGVGYRVRSDD